jgi:hypothetical protein
MFGATYSEGGPLAFQADEAMAMSKAVVRRIKEGSIPPDDAYWWTRILVAEYESMECNDADGGESEPETTQMPAGCAIAVIVEANAPKV